MLQQRQRKTSRAGILAAALAGLALATAGHSARADEVTVALSGQQEIPPVSTSASGTGTVSVAADRTITAKAIVTGMKVTVAHIHDGAAGTNGPIVIPLTQASDGSWIAPQGTKLTEAQMESYRAGRLYFNIHSEAYRAGEIRGQIKP